MKRLCWLLIALPALLLPSRATGQLRSLVRLLDGPVGDRILVLVDDPEANAGRVHGCRAGTPAWQDADGIVPLPTGPVCDAQLFPTADRLLVTRIEAHVAVVDIASGLTEVPRSATTTKTCHSRPPDDLPSVWFSATVVALKLWAYLNSGAGIAAYEESSGIERLGGSRRTLQRWIRRAQPLAAWTLQAIRRAVIERSEPRPVEQLFPRGLRLQRCLCAVHGAHLPQFGPSGRRSRLR